MGRWMKAMNKKEEVVIEMAPNFLIHCSKNLPKAIRQDFPTLVNLDLDSKHWIDEIQTFTTKEITNLKDEVLRIFKILNKQEYITNVNSDRILQFWTTEQYQLDDINNDIKLLEDFFNQSITQDLEIKIYM